MAARARECEAQALSWKQRCAALTERCEALATQLSGAEAQLACAEAALDDERRAHAKSRADARRGVDVVRSLGPVLQAVKSVMDERALHAQQDVIKVNLSSSNQYTHICTHAQ